MARPFYLPSDQDVDDLYRRLDQLLLDLYDIIRLLLFRPRTPGSERLRGTGQRTSQATPSSNRPPPRDPDTNHESPNLIVDSDETFETSGSDLALRQFCLPDLVRGALTVAATNKINSQPIRRKRRKDSKFLTSSSPNQYQPCCQSVMSHGAWFNFGIELCQTSEELSVVRSIDSQDTVVEKRRVELKASSIFSLLVPASFGGSIWTTVILLVGWKLLTLHR